MLDKNNATALMYAAQRIHKYILFLHESLNI